MLLKCVTSVNEDKKKEQPPDIRLLLLIHVHLRRK